MSATARKTESDQWGRAVGIVIAATRKDADVTQKELAEQMGWHRSTVAKIEAGEIALRVGDLIAVAKVLKVDPHQLFDRISRWNAPVKHQWSGEFKS